MIVDAWHTIMRNILYGDSDSLPTHIAMGTGTTAVTATDTTLSIEQFRYAIDAKSKSGTAKVMFQGTIPSSMGNSQVFTEVGAFNAGSGPTMVNRQTHSGILKADTFELRYQVEIEFKDVV